MWWTSTLHTSPIAASAEVDALKFELTTSVSVTATLVFLSFTTLGLAALVGGLYSVNRSPEQALSWLSAAVGLSLGGWMAAFGLGAIVQSVLHWRVPGTLIADPETLQVRVWHTWSGLWEGFRRTHTSIPRAQITGAALSQAQSGSWMVFIEHSSGIAFGTGWEASREAATDLAQQIAGWAKPPRSER